jgi:predicted TIM-barrel fold metal-dependent hydrolase
MEGDNNMDWWLVGDQMWLDQVVEEIVEPDLPIIDPHHHLWSFNGVDYLTQQFHMDTNSGHRVKKTVYVECGMSYRDDGANHLKPLGETEFVVQQAKQIEGLGGAVIDGIVARADLRLTESLEDTLSQHSEISESRLKGIRHHAARAEYPEALSISGSAPEGLYEDTKFREGLNMLGRKGLSYDAWHYHYQNQAFTALARSVPETILILDHFGTPLGVGPYAEQRNEIFIQWKKDIREMAKCENVVAKLGGLAMSDNGFGWENNPKPPTSDEFAAAQREYYLHTIECFGPNRCMMESNFPVDRNSLSYAVLINGQKKIVSDFSEAEKSQLFYGTAARIYRL